MRQNWVETGHQGRSTFSEEISEVSPRISRIVFPARLAFQASRLAIKDDKSQSIRPSNPPQRGKTDKK